MREVHTTNLEKVYWPETGTTKGEMLGYYREIAPFMVPLIEGRAVTLLRFPDGVNGKSFFTKNVPKSTPDWIRTVDIWAESSRRIVHYPIIASAEALLWAANLGAIEFHVSPARATSLDAPQYLVFDLDPGLPADVTDCARVAIAIRERLTSEGIKSLVKSSGSKGLHVLVPLNSGVEFERVEEYARGVATELAKSRPDDVVVQMNRSLRAGKVFIDWSQNQRHKTTVAPYSVRARQRPTVSAPLTWEEVEAVAESGDAERLTIEMTEALARAGSDGNLCASLLTIKQDLPGKTRRSGDFG